ncbi:MAG: hypothetical protein N4A65_14100 [Cohaesibacter sp.]|nr:hypothetical protein [Cohaesibacter sp.]
MFRYQRSYGRIAVFLLALFPIQLFAPHQVRAASFLDDLRHAVENHDRVKAAHSSTEASRQRVRVSKGDLFPKLNLKASAGRERILNPSSAIPILISPAPAWKPPS